MTPPYSLDDRLAIVLESVPPLRKIPGGRPGSSRIRIACWMRSTISSQC